MIELQLKGVSELEKRLKELGKEGEKALFKAMVETSIEAVSTMQINTPVVTNRLRSSEHFETPTTKEYYYTNNQGKDFNGRFSFGPKGLMIVFGTNVEYASNANDHSTKPKFFEKAIFRAKSILYDRMVVNYNKALEKTRNK